MPAVIRYRQFDAVAREVGRRAAVNMVQDAVRNTALDAQVGVPFRSGELSASQFQRVQRTPDSAFGIVGYHAGHAMAIHEGSRRHKIRPRDPDGALVFRHKGKLVVTKLVHHPGTKRNPWLFNALRRQTRGRGFRVQRF